MTGIKFTNNSYNRKTAYFQGLWKCLYFLTDCHLFSSLLLIPYIVLEFKGLTERLMVHVSRFKDLQSMCKLLSHLIPFIYLKKGFFFPNWKWKSMGASSRMLREMEKSSACGKNRGLTQWLAPVPVGHFWKRRPLPTTCISSAIQMSPYNCHQI